MSLYGGSLRSSGGVNTNSPILEIINTSTDFCALLEIGFTCSTGDNISFGLGQSATVGTPRADGISLLPYNVAATSFIQLATDWTIFPVMPVSYFRRESVSSNTRGVFPIVWRFPRGLKMAPSTSLVLANVQFTGFIGLAIFSDIWVDIDG